MNKDVWTFSCLFLAIIAGTLAIFVLDLWLPLGVTAGVLYAIPILLGSSTGRPRIVVGVAIVASVLILACMIRAASLFPDRPLWMAAWNGALALFVTWGASLLCLRGMREGRTLRSMCGEIDRRVRARPAELTDAVPEPEVCKRMPCYKSAAIVESSNDGIIGLSLDGLVTSWNAGAQHIYGYGPEEVTGRSISLLVPPERLEELADILKRIKAGERVQHFETVRRRKDGGLIHVSLTVSPIKDPGGRIIGASVIVRDISERKRAEEILKASQERFRLVVESAPSGILMVNREGIITMVNALMERLFGYERHELLGQPVEMLIPARFRHTHPSNRTGFHAAPSARLMGEGRDLFGLRKDGVEFPIEIGLTPIETPEGPQVLCTVINITERKRTEEALRESEARFHMLADTAPVLIWMAGADSRCVYVNKPWLDFTGRPIEREVGDGWMDNVHPDDMPACMETYRAVFPTRRPFSREYRLRRVDGEYRWMLETGVLRFSLDGEFAGYIGTCIDITERKLGEDRIRIALEQRETLLKEIHHRVKNNLQIVSSLLNLQSNASRNKKVAPLLRDCQFRVISIGLLHETLYRSRDLSRVEMLDYVRTLTDHLLRSYGVDLDSIAVTVDVDQIGLNIETALPCGLIINELLSNSLKHAFPGGRPGAIHVELRSNPDHTFTLRVRDNGIGLPPVAAIEEIRSLGLELIELFSEKLEGTAEFHRAEGTEFELRFAELPYSERM